jgi:very-short-patch-repair endonuclease
MEKACTKQISSGVIFLQKTSASKLQQARTLRKNMTPAENKLWNQLRNRKLDGLKFRRQQIIAGFIADFFCHEKKLVIEVDGLYHKEDSQKELDHKKDLVFALRGLYVIRFENEDVLENIDSVLQ